MGTMEAMKDKGNTLFRQQRFSEAVQVYTSILDQLRSSCADEAARRLECAVRLNRAWAWIQMPGRESSEAILAAAEQDCTLVIEVDAVCVKAYYRRALARERRGQWKLAIDDAATVKRLEPNNPSISPLLERLFQHQQDEECLAPPLQQCKIYNIDKAKAALTGDAEIAWQALQEAETSLQKTRMSKIKRSLAARRKGKGAQSCIGEISQKTDDLWEAMRCEEVLTIAKALPRLRQISLSK